MKRQQFLRGAAACIAGAAVGGLPLAARAQAGAWPNKPLRLIVNFPPGNLTSPHIAGEMLKSKAGIFSVRIP